MTSEPDSQPDSVDHERFMRMAIEEAARAEARGEVPVGCVLVLPDPLLGDRIVGRGHNLRESAQDPTAHAEMTALRAAASRLGSWRLTGVRCYVTLEPCPMCAGALVHARVSEVIYGADDPKAGAARTLYSIGDDPRLNHRFALRPGVLEEDCAEQLRAFFRGVRARRRRLKGS